MDNGQAIFNDFMNETDRVMVIQAQEMCDENGYVG